MTWVGGPDRYALELARDALDGGHHHLILFLLGVGVLEADPLVRYEDDIFSRVDQVSIRIAKSQLPTVAQLLKRLQLAELHKVGARYKRARVGELVG